MSQAFAAASESPTNFLEDHHFGPPEPDAMSAIAMRKHPEDEASLSTHLPSKCAGPPHCPYVARTKYAEHHAGACSRAANPTSADNGMGTSWGKIDSSSNRFRFALLSNSRLTAIVASIVWWRASAVSFLRKSTRCRSIARSR